MEPSRALGLGRTLRLRLSLTVYQEAIGARALLPARPEGASRTQEWADLGFEGFLHALARHPLVPMVRVRVPVPVRVRVRVRVQVRARASS